MNSVLLTIDLTKAVADEAIERKDCVVVAYRKFIPTTADEYLLTFLLGTDPIIFSGLKCLTLADTQQQSLLRLALEGISVNEILFREFLSDFSSCRTSRSTVLIQQSMQRQVGWEIGLQILLPAVR